MPEVWLHNNRRALALGLMLPAALVAVSIGGVAWSLWTLRGWWTGLFLALGTMPLWMMGELLFALTRPPLAFEQGELLVFLEPTKPTRVPIGIVECFFLGQGPSALPNLNGKQPLTQNVVIRLAESATDWKERQVKPSFGQWCDGYITIRGSWCEPIAPDVLKALNDRLIEAKRKEAA